MSTAQEFAAAVTVEALDRDPYPIYARLRDEAPVCLVPAVGLWFVTRWADVEDAATQRVLVRGRREVREGCRITHESTLSRGAGDARERHGSRSPAPPLNRLPQ